MKKLSFIILSMGLVLAAAVGWAKDYADKKVLYVDSYHAGYPWSDGITQGITSVLEKTGIELKVHRMDTKRNKSEKFKKQAALKAKAVIESFKPDILIASDDNASKYLIQPYFKDAQLPVVFCGVNWDGTDYGYPYENATGMVEVTPVPQLIDHLQKISRGDQVGYLSGDTLSQQKNVHYIQDIFKLDLVEYYASDFADWKKGFQQMQGKVDLLLVYNNAGIKNWDEKAGAAFARTHTRIPTGTFYDWMAPYALLGFGKVPQEQGQWAAQTALKILDGRPPDQIPIARNQKGNLIVNARIAKSQGFDIPYELIRIAQQVIE